MVAIVPAVTAAARRDPDPRPLALGATPAVIRQWLLPDDAARFVAAWEAALDDARVSPDLTDVHGGRRTLTWNRDLAHRPNRL